jgi:aspartate oxidase
MLARQESRGVHFRSDAPRPEPAWEGRRQVLRKQDPTGPQANP